MDSPRNILRTIKAAKNILIPLHLRPDGDSIGSALASYHFLHGLGKKATVVSADPVPDIFLFLPGAKKIKIVDPAELDLTKFDLIFLVDNASPARFSKKGEIKFPSQTILANIDHHESNRNFGDLNYVISDSASTAEVLYDLIKSWRIALTPEISNCLLTGVYTDTGGFLYPSTTAGSLDKAADLIRHGGNQKRIVEKAFRSWSPKALRLWSEILARTQIRKAVAYSSLPFAAL
ncbi:MAG: DHH family phosphoesterase, partial [Patescibacteria group bacterium]